MEHSCPESGRKSFEGQILNVQNEAYILHVRAIVGLRNVSGGKSYQRKNYLGVF